MLRCGVVGLTTTFLLQLIPTNEFNFRDRKRHQKVTIMLIYVLLQLIKSNLRGVQQHNFVILLMVQSFIENFGEYKFCFNKI